MFANDEEKTQQSKLLALVREAVECDESLRAKFEIGDKFRFVRERLKEVLAHLELEQVESGGIKKDTTVRLLEDEVVVYVYIFNAKGVVLRNWINMLNPKVFYEYSVNRPIYVDAKGVEEMLRTKIDKPQHAYLAVAVKKTDILQSVGDTSQKDSLGNPLIRVREGSLKLDRLISFYHNGHEYTLSSEGLVKKS
jgi:intracellular multiplication protein IcmQ